MAISKTSSNEWAGLSRAHIRSNRSLRGSRASVVLAPRRALPTVGQIGPRRGDLAHTQASFLHGCDASGVASDVGGRPPADQGGNASARSALSTSRLRAAHLALVRCEQPEHRTRCRCCSPHDLRGVPVPQGRRAR